MRKKTMETIIPTTFSLLITATQVVANGSMGRSEVLGLMVTFFMSLGVLIIFYQFLPGLLLFAGMIRGLFSSVDNKTN